MSFKKDEQTKPKNSSMAKDLREVEEHGEVMEQNRTNQEVKEAGMEPDPKQHDSNE